MQTLSIPAAIRPPGVSDVTYMTLPTGDISLSWRVDDRRYLIWISPDHTPSAVVLSVRPDGDSDMQYYDDSAPVLPVVEALMAVGMNAGLFPGPEMRA